ncbi:hypothetical protein EUTSA_v10023936mg [Eutrema salsugineum]|uniref:Knottin scorpion toxin-like domain-containing protein n=1 Tax=Eutrema salsugineum TaxID=72664 RepID=V4JUA9_EUTSA|nr:hypothetical protein EUTSA_v10023936mg [Eutrema salsugineum]
MASSKTILLIVLVALLLSCVWMSNAREMKKGPPNHVDDECVGEACPPTSHGDQYFGSCFKDDDCVGSCFNSCRIKKCTNHICTCAVC